MLYQLNVDNDGDPAADIEYQFRFTTTDANPNTFLYNTGQVTTLDDADLNVRQTYTVTEVNNDDRQARRRWAATSRCAPANVGPRSTPGLRGRTSARKGVQTILGDGITVFAGPRDDPFFVDLGSIFDLGGLRPFNPAHLIPLPAEDGEDYVAGFNVHSIALQVPKSRLVDGDPRPIGVWATTYRRAQRIAQRERRRH